MALRASDWRGLLNARVQCERARRERLPDLRAVRLSRDDWDQRTRESGLQVVFDASGRPAGPTDDETYDAVEAQMRVDGRHDELKAFAETRPLRRFGDPPRSCFVDTPDLLRRGPPSRDFELRVRPRASGLEAVSIRALSSNGRPSAGPWAMLSRVGDRGLRVSGSWELVPNETFERLLAATDTVLGPAPRFTQPELEESASIQHGGTCGCCGDDIVGRGLCVGLSEVGEVEPLGAVNMHLTCSHRAHPGALRRAIEFHRLGDEDLSVVRMLELGRVARCEACREIIPKGTWRLSSVYAKGALHLRCAVEAEPDGFRDALRYSPELPDAVAWRAKLA